MQCSECSSCLPHSATISCWRCNQRAQRNADPTSSGSWWHPKNCLSAIPMKPPGMVAYCFCLLCSTCCAGHSDANVFTESKRPKPQFNGETASSARSSDIRRPHRASHVHRTTVDRDRRHPEHDFETPVARRIVPTVRRLLSLQIGSQVP